MIGTTISHYKILEKLGESGNTVFDKDYDFNAKNIIVVNFYRFLIPSGLSCLLQKYQITNKTPLE